MNIKQKLQGSHIADVVLIFIVHEAMQKGGEI